MSDHQMSEKERKLYYENKRLRSDLAQSNIDMDTVCAEVEKIREQAHLDGAKAAGEIEMLKNEIYKLTENGRILRGKWEKADSERKYWEKNSKSKDEELQKAKNARRDLSNRVMEMELDRDDFKKKAEVEKAILKAQIHQFESVAESFIETTEENSQRFDQVNKRNTYFLQSSLRWQDFSNYVVNLLDSQADDVNEPLEEDIPVMLERIKGLNVYNTDILVNRPCLWDPATPHIACQIVINPPEDGKQLYAQQMAAKYGKDGTWKKWEDYKEDEQVVWKILGIELYHEHTIQRLLGYVTTEEREKKRAEEVAEQKAEQKKYDEKWKRNERARVNNRRNNKK